MAFHGNSGSVNAPHCYVTSTLPIACLVRTQSRHSHRTDWHHFVISEIHRLLYHSTLCGVITDINNTSPPKKKCEDHEGPEGE